MPKSLFCLVVFLLSGGTAAAQYPDDEYYPYAEREERRELLVTDSTLFYRAVQSAADLYGEQTDFNLPQVAFKRRGLERRAGRISFAGMDLSYRYLPACAAGWKIFGAAQCACTVHFVQSASANIFGQISLISF